MSARYVHVDALRAVAALLVVWLHSIEYFGRLSRDGGLVHALAGGSLDLGRVGVVIFFAISGFVIPASLSDAPGAIKRFAVKRFFRLYPAYWVSVALAGGLALVIADRSDPTPLQLLANLTMLQEFLGVRSLQGLYWTLHVELVFYALCALAWVYGLGRSPAFLPAAVLAMAAGCVACLALAHLGGGKDSTAHTAGMYCLHLSIMFWGAIVRRWYDGASLRLTERVVLRGAVAGWLALLGVALLGRYGGWLPAASDYVRLGLSYPLAILAFLVALRVWRRPGAVMAYLGRISYSIYLLHPVVVIALFHLADAMQFDRFSSVGLLAIQCLVMLLSVLLAALCYRWVEDPAIEAGSRIGRRFRPAVGVA